MLILDVLESVHPTMMSDDFEISESDHQLVKDLNEIWEKLSPRSMLEDWHDAEDIREEALDLFRMGMIDLKTRRRLRVFIGVSPMR